MKKKNVFLPILVSSLFLLGGLWKFCPANVSGARDAFQVVESVPSETNLGSADVPRTLDVWLNMISSAQKTLDIEVFYISSESGHDMEKVLAAIKNAAGRGVKVRVIVDSVFYRKDSKAADELKAVPGVTLRVIPFSETTGGIMHAKFFVVDGVSGFVGSQNFDWRALEHIHEIGVSFIGKELAGTFLKVFEKDWKLCAPGSPSETSASRTTTVNSDNPLTIESDRYGSVQVYPAFSPKGMLPKGMNWEEEELVKLIAAAGKEIRIQVMNFAPKERKKGPGWHVIDDALKNAAARGVEVKLLLSSWAVKKNTVKFLTEMSAVPGIELRIITIPQHSSGPIPFSRVDHSKYMVVDGNLSWISTANWEWSYFNNTRNATLIVDSVPVAEQLRDIFARSWDSGMTASFDPGAYQFSQKSSGE